MQQVAAKKVSDDSDLASVSVTVSEGRAVLTGTVNSSAAKAKAEKFVREVRGVRSIDNKIVVSVQ
jgi:osmotically-inducible protein OsmY